MCLLWRPSHSLFKMALGIFGHHSATDTSCTSTTTTDPWSTIICSTFLHHLERKRKGLKNLRKREGMDILKKIINREKHKTETIPKMLEKVLSLVCRKNCVPKKPVLCQVRAYYPGGDQRHVAQHGTEFFTADHRLAHRLQKNITASHAQPKPTSPICLFSSLLIQGRNWRQTTALKVFLST